MVSLLKIEKRLEARVEQTELFQRKQTLALALGAPIIAHWAARLAGITWPFGEINPGAHQTNEFQAGMLTLSYLSIGILIISSAHTISEIAYRQRNKTMRASLAAPTNGMFIGLLFAFVWNPRFIDQSSKVQQHIQAIGEGGYMLLASLFVWLFLLIAVIGPEKGPKR